MTKNVLAPLTALLLVTSAAPAFAADTDRQSQVEKKGAGLMPFSQAATMHEFTPTATGGVQAVLVHTGDAKQVLLVRSHLRKEALAFAHGDYSDPASIHGQAMPELQTMRANARRIRVRYADVPRGASIAFTTSEPALVSAIHAWFKAQVRDHGAHAAMSM